MSDNSSFMTFYKGIIDSTLREGQQYHLANFTQSNQRKIVQMLSQVGVDRIEVGNPVVRKVASNIGHLVKIKNKPKLLCHIRNRMDDLKAAIESGVDGINIICTVDKQRLDAMGCSLEQYLEKLRGLVLLAKEHDLEVRVSVEDYFNCDPNDAAQVYGLAESLGVDRIGVADTLGVAMGWEVEMKISQLRRQFSTDIEVHFHNDVGQANSNALIAIKSGANWVDTTLLGIGERSGITALSTFLAALYICDPEISKRYNLQHVTKTENALARMIGKEVPFNLLTNRENGFAHKAGIHLHALVNFGPSTYEPISPGVLGNARRLIHDSEISGRTDEKNIKDFYIKYGRG